MYEMINKNCDEYIDNSFIHNDLKENIYYTIIYDINSQLNYIKKKQIKILDNICLIYRLIYNLQLFICLMICLFIFILLICK